MTDVTGDIGRMPGTPKSAPCVLASMGRLTAWAVLLLLLAAYAYLAFRTDSSFFTVPWMPREMARRILSVTNYRNFWGFGFLGFYCALFLGAWWWVRRNSRIQWGTVAVLLLPLVKELLQSPIPGRHGTWHGAAYGFVGALLGLALGCGLREALLLCRRRWGSRASRQKQQRPNLLRDSDGVGG